MGAIAIPRQLAYSSAMTLDAIVIGAGPNGLAAAITLARADKSVRVYERAPSIGGSTRSEALNPSADLKSRVRPWRRTWGLGILVGLVLGAGAVACLVWRTRTEDAELPQFPYLPFPVAPGWSADVMALALRRAGLEVLPGVLLLGFQA